MSNPLDPPLPGILESVSWGDSGETALVKRMEKAQEAYIYILPIYRQSVLPDPSHKDPPFGKEENELDEQP